MPTVTQGDLNRLGKAGFNGATLTYPFNVNGSGDSASAQTAQIATYSAGAAPTAGNIYNIGVVKTGYQEVYLGINKNTTTNSIPASAAFLTTYDSTATLTLGLGDSNGAPGTADIKITSGLVTFGGNAKTTGYNLRSVGNALSGAGTTRTDATQLAAEVNNVTTAASGTGVILPVGVIGMRITVFNAGANPLKVYGSASETIDGTAGSTGVALANAKRCDYFFVAANTWISAQLGVVSA